MKMLSPPGAALVACATLSWVAVACASRPLREQVASDTTSAPPTCGPNRVGAGWLELQSAIAPVSFCVHPGLQLVRGGVHQATPRRLLPYPQARSRHEAWETWKTPDGHAIIETSLHEGPDQARAWARGATELRETTVTGGCTGEMALLRQYRVPAVWNRPEPGTDRRADTYNAYIELPIGPMRRFTLEAIARDTTERAKLIPVLQSACRVDR